MDFLIVINLSTDCSQEFNLHHFSCIGNFLILNELNYLKKKKNLVKINFPSQIDQSEYCISEWVPSHVVNGLFDII